MSIEEIAEDVGLSAEEVKKISDEMDQNMRLPILYSACEWSIS